jgi:hypothetical protein
MARFSIKAFYTRYWLVLYGVADIKIYPEKKGGGDKPHEDESAFRKYNTSTRNDKMKLTTWSPTQKNTSRYKMRKQVPITRDLNILRYFMKHKILPTKLSAQSSKHRNREEVTRSRV